MVNLLSVGVNNLTVTHGFPFVTSFFICYCNTSIVNLQEIRYKDLAFIDNLTHLQYNILVHASKYLKSGGVLVYSTCTLNRAENDTVCDRFLQENPDFEKLEAYTTLLPHKDGTDGFFFARLGRKAQ